MQDWGWSAGRCHCGFSRSARQSLRRLHPQLQRLAAVQRHGLIQYPAAQCSKGAVPAARPSLLSRSYQPQRRRRWHPACLLLGSLLSRCLGGGARRRAAGLIWPGRSAMLAFVLSGWPAHRHTLAEVRKRAIVCMIRQMALQSTCPSYLPMPTLLAFRRRVSQGGYDSGRLAHGKRCTAA